VPARRPSAVPAVIDLIDAQLLKVAAPETPIQMLAVWPDPLKLGCQRFAIDGVRPIAALLAQGSHESQGFTKLKEDLFYKTPDRIQAIFGQGVAGRARFPSLKSCEPYVRNPEALANYVYANRMGNGPPSSGDGWRHRGEGVFMLTGKANQAEFGAAMGMPLDDVPDYLATVNGAAMSACWFFRRHGLEDLAITPGIIDDTKAINGGLIGLDDRTRRFNAVVAELLRRGA
jgi:putative chitinase